MTAAATAGARTEGAFDRSPGGSAYAHVGGRLATGLLEVSHDLAALDTAGSWVVVVTFEGAVTCARFADARPAQLTAAPLPAAPWQGPDATAWTSSLSRTDYLARVERVRQLIAEGAVYQVNVCRVLSAPTRCVDLAGLASRLGAANPSRYPALIQLPTHGISVCAASPELFLSRTRAGGVDTIETKPIKGTGRTVADISAKDYAENVMIVDMARNDLGRIAVTGSVDVPALCTVEDYPGLVHLVSTVRARLRPSVTWPEIFAATFPPASVTGAPKSRALEVIAELEPTARGPYCGAIGWVDADRGLAEIAVGIRTFWLDDDQLHFGTGAGITSGSDPAAEWAETELKAELPLAIASTG